MKSDENAIYLRAIRQAFANNNAAVMVGAGFSRNADGGDSLATWPMVAQALAEALDPDADPKSFSTGNVTQLGEQYARVFSAPALENLLKQLIPDDKVAPGLLHDQLLKLPWAEIFTTNYDTLLERAAEKILDRAHFTVCCREDIPLSKILDRRRIVKLHGSFPSRRPFIFTEENYRRYPKDFAPFVNLVRQSLLENVFCLIGFSGDDPNFLHWIGWVRDMLEDHALPIYLFVHSMPPLGQRKLLEARRVVPVVVPKPDGCEENDYRARYLELFKILRTPLGAIDSEWGEFSTGAPNEPSVDDSVSQLHRLVTVLPNLAAQRASYPGWLVAPATVRRAFHRSLRRLWLPLESHKGLRLEDSPHAIVALFSYYVWQQAVLLGPIYDDFAEATVLALRETSVISLPLAPDASNVLGALGITSQKHFREAWKQSCIGVLRWARQELRWDVFGSIRTLLESRGCDRALGDEIEYEAILFDLYLGDSAAAHLRLTKWRPGSADGYMLVRKGVLLSELGEVEAGLTLCMDGIQQLRAAQKVSKQSTMLLSKEAWACLVAHNIQRARTLFGRLGILANNDLEEDFESLENLSTRLSSMAAKGMDVRHESDEMLAQLNAEAQPPSLPRYRFPGFDLGMSNVTQRFGITSELSEKMNAAEAWLNLADRVGLVPRIGNVRFTVDAYTQAAWWIQYNNSTRRMLSVAIRTSEDGILKPKDESLPNHKTGWLSRYQVARVPIDAAVDICGRALTQAELSISSSRQLDEVRMTCKFNAEIFSRLVIRIDNVDLLRAFTQRLISLHCAERLQHQPSLWESFNLALSRCLEALPPNIQLELVGDLIKIPLLPAQAADSHYADDWVRPLRGLSFDEKETKSDDQKLIQAEISKLVTEVSVPESAPDLAQRRRPFVWDRLFALKALGFVREKTAKIVGSILWQGQYPWPRLAHFPDMAATIWPTPAGIDVPDRFREFVLSGRLAGLSSRSAMAIQQKGSHRAWGFPTDDRFLRNWISSREQEPWGLEATVSGLSIVKNWWDEEWIDIEHAISSSSNLREAVVARLHLLDQVLQLSADFVVGQPDALPADINDWISQLVIAAQRAGCPMWRFRLQRELKSGNPETVNNLQSEVAEGLFSTDPDISREVCWAVRSWIADVNAPSDHLNLIIDSVFSVVAARRLPALPNCIWIVEDLIRKRGTWVTEARGKLLATGMSILLRELDYTSRPSGTDIPDEHVPLLRFLAARLAHTSRSLDVQGASGWQASWIRVAEADPLPEMRFLKWSTGRNGSQE